MAKQFKLYISHLDAQIEGSAAIDLPAGPYALQDALEKARVTENDLLLLEMDSCRCGELGEWFNSRESGRDTVQVLHQLNALADRMESLDTWNIIALGGALRIEAAKNPEMQFIRLCDLADALQVYNFAGAANDRELGRFYVDNGFLPETENMPDSLIEKLDFQKIGREMREAEGGVYLDSVRGYLVQSEEILESHSGIDVTPPQPDYAALVYIGWPDCGDAEKMKLPASEEELSVILDNLGAQNFDFLAWRCFDCKIPALADAFSTCESIEEMNEAAWTLDGLSEMELSTCKALVEVMKPGNLAEAMSLMDQRNDYTLDQDVLSPADVGMSRLKTALPEDEITLLAPHVNLYAYGESAMKLYNMELTDYGGLERWDGQPVHAPQKEPAQEGGMELR